MSTEISGDVRLGLWDRLRYIGLNAIRNMRGLGAGGTDRFAAPVPECTGQSPSRLLAQAFLEHELPRLITPARPVDVIEVGCGTGGMLARLSRLGYRGRYAGMDIWNRFDPQNGGAAFEVSFEEIDAHEYRPDYAADLLLSFSVLEHIPRDDELIARMAQWVKPGGLEVHIVPAAAGLVAYLWHGYRQYSVAALRRKFGPEARIIPLGGFGTLVVHVAFITIPEMLLGASLRRRAPGLYARAVRAGIALDRVLPVGATAHVVIRRHR